MEILEKSIFVQTTPFEVYVAITENGKLVEYYVERKKDKGYVGNIYKGKVERVLPGLQSAFVDIGLEKNGFLYVGDFKEVFKDSEDLFFNGEEDIKPVETPKDKIQKRVENSELENDKKKIKVIEKEVPAPLDFDIELVDDSDTKSVENDFEKFYFLENENSLSLLIKDKNLNYSRSSKHRNKKILNFAYKNDYLNISRKLKKGQDIIVQVMKDPISTKSARLTSYIALPGRYVVYLPTINKRVGVSRKISCNDERKRLREIVKKYLEGKDSGGFIVRTASEGCSKEDLIQDIEFLIKLWNKILNRSRDISSPALLYEELTLIERVIRDKVDSHIGEIWIDSEETYAIVLEFFEIFMPDLIDKVKFYAGEEKLFDYFNISNDLNKAFRRKVWLKSGGFIIIDHTEALISIDVNSGKFIGKGNFEDSVTRTNLEAAREIARQIRLRNLGGIIVIDFIDMADKKNRKSVLNVLSEELKRDRTPVKILPFNEFGLVILTRKRVQASLEKIFSQKCVMCGGNGFIKSISSLCYEIYDSIYNMRESFSGRDIVIRAHPLVIEGLKTSEREVVDEIKKLLNMDVVLIEDYSIGVDKFSIENVI